ncbi:hypothetical protein Tco_0453739 [Tanacetum coccineum]
MRTRSQARKRRQQQVRQTSVESPNLEKPNPPIVTMEDNRTMAQLLEAPTEGYEDAIVVPEINANNFEIKHASLLQEMDDPNITMEEYIQLMADKARGRDQTFNWETATYDEVYCDDPDLFTYFKTDFPAIVYNDASTSNQNVSYEPTIRIVFL